MAEQDWSKVERTQDLIDYVYAKYENSWKESDETTDEMLDDLYNFAMMKEKYLSMVESKKGKAKLIVSDEMVEYVLAKYGKNWNFEDEIVEVILEDLRIKYGKEHDKGKAKQAEHDLDDVDLNHVDLDGLDLENRVKKLKEEFSRMLKAKKANEAKEEELKVNEEVVQVSSDEGFSSDEDFVCFNDVKYPLTDVEIRMFKERPTTSRALTASTFAFKSSTRSKALIASTSNAQDASTLAPIVYMRIAMTGCVLGLRALDDPNAPPPSAPQKRKSKP
ncbi:hypothetical protein Tco_0116599 [Tanacetum coccineum]